MKKLNKSATALLIVLLSSHMTNFVALADDADTSESSQIVTEIKADAATDQVIAQDTVSVAIAPEPVILEPELANSAADNLVADATNDDLPQSQEADVDVTSEPVSESNGEDKPASEGQEDSDKTVDEEPSEQNQAEDEAPTETNDQSSDVVEEKPAETPNTSTDRPAPSENKAQEVQPAPSAPSVPSTSNVAPTPVVEQITVDLPQQTYVQDFDYVSYDDDDILTYTTYVEHWSGKDAYTHNLLSHRYGITAEQLDGFLKNTGINYDSKRINGAKLLEWEKKSGLDVRAIVAIAMAESSLGTQGVARLSGANMFGYAAFDLSPNQALNYNDDTAVRKLTSETIVRNKNLTFKVQDQKAQKLAAGQFNFATDGGVYYTDTSGTGKRRAQIMEDLDKWIDEHGGTPEIPAELRTLNTVMLATVPADYTISTAINSTLYSGFSYPWGECTWYVYNRAQELGYRFDAYMGNGADWQLKAGYETTHEPKTGYALSFSPGQAGADPTYGHVAIVEEVKEDGSILISESNAMGRGVVSYRTFSAAQAAQFTYVIGHQ